MVSYVVTKFLIQGAGTISCDDGGDLGSKVCRQQHSSKHPE